MRPMRRAVSALCLLLLVAASAGCAHPPAPDEGGPGDGGAGNRDLRAVNTPCGNCAGRTPVCDMKTRLCVGCLADSDCPMGQHCFATQCKPGCSAQVPCGDAGVCNLDGGVCAGCVADAQCTDPKAPFCDKPSGRCVACNAKNDKCPAGEYCAGAMGCQPGCKQDQECIDQNGESSLCCGHACDDTWTSSMNCGLCNNPCPGGGPCCSGSCTDTSSDPGNCGSCGRVCSLPRAQVRCLAGICEIAGCQGGYGDCDRNPGNGCEADFDDDDDNCGRCGKSCVFVCIGGTCIPF